MCANIVQKYYESSCAQRGGVRPGEAARMQVQQQVSVSHKISTV